MSAPKFLNQETNLLTSTPKCRVKKKTNHVNLPLLLLHPVALNLCEHGGVIFYKPLWTSQTLWNHQLFIRSKPSQESGVRVSSCFFLNRILVILELYFNSSVVLQQASPFTSMAPRMVTSTFDLSSESILFLFFSVPAVDFQGCTPQLEMLSKKMNTEKLNISTSQPVAHAKRFGS